LGAGLGRGAAGAGAWPPPRWAGGGERSEDVERSASRTGHRAGGRRERKGAAAGLGPGGAPLDVGRGMGGKEESPASPPVGYPYLGIRRLAGTLSWLCSSELPTCPACGRVMGIRESRGRGLSLADKYPRETPMGGKRGNAYRCGESLSTIAGRASWRLCLPSPDATAGRGRGDRGLGLNGNLWVPLWGSPYGVPSGGGPVGAVPGAAGPAGGALCRGRGDDRWRHARPEGEARGMAPQVSFSLEPSGRAWSSQRGLKEPESR